MTESLVLDPKSTALVVIDLQRGIMARETFPHTVPDVLARSVRLVDSCRKAGVQVVLVNVGFSADEKDRLSQLADSPNPPGRIAPGYSDLDPALGSDPNDLLITKRQWGAFYGTALDQQLRRRGIKTIILCGIATNFGVESTARDAWERNYELVFAEDAMAGMAPGAHEFAIKTILPRLGRIRRTGDILAALPA
jgi:nicotinamidase-related amidase